MSTLLPEPPPADVLVWAALVVLLVVLAAALFAVMFGKSAAERVEECAADLDEQAFALTQPGAVATGWHELPAATRPPRATP
ncbi:MAG: hypothetical protein DI587_17140 [Variovorax paradoxus]|nr:MAG: hypothetical protein DI583_17140 [Variovorax paradoxus]PZQ08960.1 MAG: hypothetical protein DI587_17140 [Variovorax paradoxus]